MKYCLLICAICFSLLACKSDDKKVTVTDENADGTTTKTEVNVKGMETSADALTAKMEALKKLPALSIEQMKGMLPEELDGAKRTNYNATATMGYTYVASDYKKDDKTSLEVKLFDCAGEMGAAFYSTTFWTGMSFQQENEKEYTKTVDFMGGRAIEKYNKEDNQSSLTYIVSDRVLVTLEGQNMSPDELKTAAQKLNFKI